MDKGEWLLYCVYVKGESIEVLLLNMIVSLLVKLLILKLMCWGVFDVYFVCLVYMVILLLGDKVILVIIFGILFDCVICGYCFMGELEFIIDYVDQYLQILLECGKVIVDYEQCKVKIKVDV